MIEITKRFFVRAEKFILFLFFLLFFTFLLYITGNFQLFLDANQVMLLRIANAISALLLVCSVFYGSILMVTDIGKEMKKDKRIRRYILFTSLFLFSAFIFFMSRFILVWV
ncbi:MAG: hypothetical protein FWC36_10785 [Spirochaetes bacterium]|nr:hypothetical protein [Spirochaetota bacterium]